MCGIAGYGFALESTVDRTVAARALLAGIAERGADSVGFAYRGDDSKVTVHKQRTGASELLDRIEVPQTATQLLVHVRDYTKGHPRVLANNHPIRHGEYSSVELGKREVREGSVLAVNGGRIVGRDSFRPDMSFEEQPLPAVRAPNEARATLARLALLYAV